ncbi:MAG: hypothetical protein U1F15_01880 [Burkholderiales bacterium]
MTENIHSVVDVFTPTRPARLAFVERASINDKLVSSMRTPGKQIVVYGHSGSGKTTVLLNKLNQLYESHITSRCMLGVTFEQLVLDAFDQLAPFYNSESATSTQRSKGSSLNLEYTALKAQIAGQTAYGSQEKKQRLLPPQLTPQALGRFLGAAKACWVLEDFHKTNDSEKTKVAQLMKVFMDMADEYPTLKIIALGAVDTAREVVQYDPEMRNRVAEINVPLMTDVEIEEIIDKGQTLLNLEFEGPVKRAVVHYSNGLASACHHLCLNMCSVSGVEFTSAERMVLGTEVLERALKLYVDEASDTLKFAFDRALRRKKTRKFDNAKLILKALSECPQDGATRAQLYQKIRAVERDYPQPNLTAYLKRLELEESGAIVRHDIVSGKYSFNDPLFRAFALALFKDSEATRRFEIVDIESVLHSLTITFARTKVLENGMDLVFSPKSSSALGALELKHRTKSKEPEKKG